MNKEILCTQCLEEKKIIKKTKQKCIVCCWGNCIEFKRHRYKPYTAKELKNNNLTIIE